MRLNIEYVDTDSLTAYKSNAKIHTSEQIERIKKSIREFGFNDPIAIWKNNEIIEGHGRYLSAIELGIKKVPVIRLDTLTDEERKAYMLIHNQLTLNTGFDTDVLDEELEQIIDIDMGEFNFNGVNPFDPLDGWFTDKEPKKVQCPNCGEWFEIE